MSQSQHSIVLSNVEQEEPTEEEVQRYAEWLGLDLEKDQDLMWIAHEGLRAALPDGWKPCKTADDEYYYFNFKTGESIWDHPLDQEYKKRAMEEKAKKMEREQIKRQMELKKRMEANSSSSSSSSMMMMGANVSGLSVGASSMSGGSHTMGLGGEPSSLYAPNTSVFSAAPTTSSLTSFNKLSPLKLNTILDRPVLGMEVSSSNKSKTTRVSVFSSSSDDDNDSCDEDSSRNRLTSQSSLHRGSDTDTFTFSSNDDDDDIIRVSESKKVISLTASSKKRIKSPLSPSQVNDGISAFGQISSDRLFAKSTSIAEVQTELVGNLVSEQDLVEMEKHKDEYIKEKESNFQEKERRWQLDRLKLEDDVQTMKREHSAELESLRQRSESIQLEHERELQTLREMHSVEVETYEQQRNSQHGEIERLKDEIIFMKNERDAQERGNKTNDDTIQKLERELREANDRLQDVKGENEAQIQSLLSRHEEEQAKLQQALANMQKKHIEEHHRQMELAKIENEKDIAALTRKIDILEARAENDLKETFKTKDDELQTLEKENIALRNEIKTLQARIANSSDDTHGNAESDLKKTKETHAHEVLNMRKQHDKVVNGLRDQLQRVENELRNVRDETRKRLEDQQQSKTENQEIKLAAEDDWEEMEQLRKDLVQAQRKNSDLERAQELLRQDLSDLRLENHEMQRNEIALRQELEATRALADANVSIGKKIEGKMSNDASPTWATKPGSAGRQLENNSHQHEISEMRRRIDALQYEQDIIQANMETLKKQQQSSIDRQQAHVKPSYNHAATNELSRTTKATLDVSVQCTADSTSDLMHLKMRWKENALRVIVLEKQRISKAKQFIADERQEVRKKQKMLEAARREWKTDLQRNQYAAARGIADCGTAESNARANDRILKGVHKLLEKQANRLNQEIKEINELQRYLTSWNEKVCQTEKKVQSDTHPQLLQYLQINDRDTAQSSIPELHISSSTSSDSSFHDEEENNGSMVESSDDSLTSCPSDFTEWWDSELPRSWTDGGIQVPRDEKENSKPKAKVLEKRDYVETDYRKPFRESKDGNIGYLRTNVENKSQKKKPLLKRRSKSLEKEAPVISSLPNYDLAAKYDKYFRLSETTYPWDRTLSGRLMAFQMLFQEWDVERNVDREFLRDHGEWLHRFRRELSSSRYKHSATVLA